MAWGGQEKKRAEETILRKLKKCHERAMNINAFLRSRGEQKQKILNVAYTEKTSKISIFLQGFGTFPHFEIHQGKKSGQKIISHHFLSALEYQKGCMGSRLPQRDKKVDFSGFFLPFFLFLSYPLFFHLPFPLFSAIQGEYNGRLSRPSFSWVGGQ